MVLWNNQTAPFVTVDINRVTVNFNHDPDMSIRRNFVHFIRTGETPAARRRREREVELRAILGNARRQAEVYDAYRRRYDFFVPIEVSGVGGAARMKARALLLRYLTSEQRRDFKRRGLFEVVGKGGNIYRVAPSGVYVSSKQPEGNGHLCIYPEDGYSLPDADRMLAIKLYIEANEEEFLATAVFTPHLRQAVFHPALTIDGRQIARA